MRKSAGCSCHCTGLSGSASQLYKPLAPEFTEDTVQDARTEPYTELTLWASGHQWVVASYVRAIAAGEDFDIILPPLRWRVAMPDEDHGQSYYARQLATFTSAIEASEQTIDIQRQQRSLLPASGLGHIVPNTPKALFLDLSHEMLTDQVWQYLYPEASQAWLARSPVVGYLQIRLNGEPVGPLYNPDSWTLVGQYALKRIRIYFPAYTAYYSYLMNEGFEFEYGAGDELEIDIWPLFAGTNSTGSTKYLGYIAPLRIIDTEKPDELYGVPTAPRASERPWMWLVDGAIAFPDFSFAQHTFRLISDTGLVSEQFVRSRPQEYFDVLYIGDEYAGTFFLDIAPDGARTDMGIVIKWGHEASDVLQYNEGRWSLHAGRGTSPFKNHVRIISIDGGVRIINDTDVPLVIGTRHNQSIYDAQWDHFQLVPGGPFIYDDWQIRFLHMPSNLSTTVVYQMYYNEQYLFDFRLDWTLADFLAAFQSLNDVRYHYVLLWEGVPSGVTNYMATAFPALPFNTLNVRQGGVRTPNGVIVTGGDGASFNPYDRAYKKVVRHIVSGGRYGLQDLRSDEFSSYAMTLKYTLNTVTVTLTVNFVIPAAEVVDLHVKIDFPATRAQLGWTHVSGAGEYTVLNIQRTQLFRCSSEDYVRYVKNAVGTEFDLGPEGVFSHLDESYLVPVTDTGWQLASQTNTLSVLFYPHAVERAYPPSYPDGPAAFWSFNGVPEPMQEILSLLNFGSFTTIKEDIYDRYIS